MEWIIQSFGIVKGKNEGWGGFKETGGSGVHPVQEAGKGDGFPDVVQAAEPGHQALDAHPEAAVGHAAVAPQVQVPLQGLLGQVMLLNAGQQGVQVVDALGAPDNLAIALRGQHIHAEGQALGSSGSGSI